MSEEILLDSERFAALFRGLEGTVAGIARYVNANKAAVKQLKHYGVAFRSHGRKEDCRTQVDRAHSKRERNLLLDMTEIRRLSQKGATVRRAFQ